jgi:hypothetical protein
VSPREPLAELPFATRLWFAWVCFFRVLLDPAFAARAYGARDEAPALPPPHEEPKPPPPEPKKAAPAPAPTPADATGPALQLLALLQRDGRLIDFLEQEIASFGDAEIGAVARVVHEGCRKALHDHATIEPLRAEHEGARVTIEDGYEPARVKLIGDVKGSAPYRGVLRHRGWRAAKITLPRPVTGHDATVLTPAEVEL